MPYFGFEPTASDTLSVFKYVATASQTTFTGSDADGATLSYDVGDGSCQVYLNGIRLDRSDVTATNGTSVVLAACTTGDIIHIQATKAFIPADVVSASSGGTFASAVTLSGGVSTTTVTASGDVTGLTLNATGATSAGDNAAIGYTAANGLVLTGQGSTNDIMVLNDTGQECINIGTGSSHVEISEGSIYFGTASRGVYLGVTTPTDANLLDDYEEGTFTPTAAGNFSGTVDMAEGHYTKIGNVVAIWAHVRLSATADGSSCSIAGLPFAAQSFGQHHHALSQGYTFSDLGPLYPQVTGGAAEIFWYTTGTGSAGVAPSYSAVGTDAAAIRMSVGGVYRTS